MDKLLNHPTSLKVIAVLVALLIWVVVHIDPETSPQSVTSNTDTKVIEAAAIVHEGLNTDKYILTAMEPTVARLVVEGRISSLLAANNDDYVVKLDLTGVGPGIQELPLTVDLPSGIRDIEISPRVVMVQIEELETQTHEVKVLTEGTPAEGYLIGESSIIGDTGNVVEVTMPKDDYARLGMVAVTVDVSGADAAVVNKKAKVVAYDTQGNPINNVTIVPDTLTAETKITLPSKEVPVQLRYTGTLPEGYSLVSISTPQQSVTINAMQAKLDEVAMFDGFILDLSKVKETGQIMVKAEKTDGIAAVTPEEIPVNIVIEATEQRTMSNIPVTLIGLADDLKASIDNSSNGRIPVNIKGATTLLQRLRASDIKLSLDVTGLAVGTHELTVDAQLPAYLQIAETDEFSLSVTVKISSTEEVDALNNDPNRNDGTQQETDQKQPDGGSGSTGATSGNDGVKKPQDEEDSTENETAGPSPSDKPDSKDENGSTDDGEAEPSPTP
ncbi:CdaR family protein [Paenibacillus camelliae]|uniref:CdaR family protein n=1 Tax=Paenibacillus camelliae TaxID=512410 RepID=UPI00203C0C49|nr:CdaR family protein [Paenibacillus camelliae]MCM3634973.1 CdaR family protein [Paenibacillus camelliae]